MCMVLTVELDVWRCEPLVVPHAAKIHSSKCLHQDIQGHLHGKASMFYPLPISDEFMRTSLIPCPVALGIYLLPAAFGHLPVEGNQCQTTGAGPN